MGKASCFIESPVPFHVCQPPGLMYVRLFPPAPSCIAVTLAAVFPLGVGREQNGKSRATVGACC